jgi:hypothetical protein
LFFLSKYYDIQKNGSAIFCDFALPFLSLAVLKLNLIYEL